MANRYRVLDHPKRLEIEDAILRGESEGKIAEKYGVSSSAIGRYKQKFLREASQAVKIENMDDIVRRLTEYLNTVDEMHDSYVQWLSDPDDPVRISMFPRAKEMQVIYEYADEKGKTQRAKKTLQYLIDKVEGTLEYRVDEVIPQIKDPREMLLKTIETLNKSLELLAKAKGGLADAKIEVKTVTGNVDEIVGKIRDALKPWPEAITAVANALCPPELPFEEQDEDV